MTNYFTRHPEVPDLATVNMMVATPCGHGQYESTFMNSLFGTMKEIERLGGRAHFAEMLYCADLAYARSKLLGKFYRSDYTHLMWIDADMGWNPRDVIRLIIEDREFIGAAGPKKEYPITFAANMSDDSGNARPVLQEGDNGVVEVSEIGMAFMLITRSCVERIIQRHPELEFTTEDKNKEYDLFQSMIVNKRRFSEDYSFCRRWRGCGGRVLILTDIEFKHTGSHTFKGCLEQDFNDQGLKMSPRQAQNLRNTTLEDIIGVQKHVQKS